MTLDGAAIAPDALSDMQLQFSAPPNDNGYALVGVVAGLDLRLGRGKLIHACVARPPSPLGPSPCVPLPANGSAACSPRWPDRSGAFSPTAPRGRSWEERARSAFNRRFRAVRFGAVLAPPDPELAVTLGDGQSAAGTQAFGTPLEVSIRTSWGAPTPGVRVDFSAPAGAATAVFPNFSSTFSVLTDRSGRAQAPCQASCQAGSYAVSATALGSGRTASFSLTNVPVAESCTPEACVSLTPSQIGAAGPTTVQIDVVFPVGGLLGASASLNGLDVLQLLLPFVTDVTSTSARVVIPNLVFPPGTNAIFALTLLTTQGNPSACLQIQVP